MIAGKDPIALVSFDLDGTILRGMILDHVRVPRALRERIALLDVLFEQGKLGYEERLQVQFALLSGVSANEIAPDPEYLPLIGDLQATLDRLRRKLGSWF